MDVGQFIASVVSSLAWPASVVVIALVFRRQLRSLFSELPRRLKAGPLELEWDRVFVKTAGVEDTPSPREQPADGDNDSELADLLPLASAHPSATVLEAANRIEQELRTKFSSAGIDVPPSRGMRNLARRAASSGLISDETLQTVNGLAVLRNLAAHGAEDLTAAKARDYLVLADGAIQVIRNEPRSS